MTVMTNARFDAEIGVGREGRHLPDGRTGGQGAGGAPGRDDARRHRSRREHRGHRPRDDQGRDRQGRHQGQRPDADEGAARLRDRRHRSAACGWPTSPATRGSPPRTSSPARPTSTRWTTTAQPRATYCRPEIASIGLTEEQVKAAGTPVQGRQGPVPGDRQGDHRRRVRGLRQGHREHRDTRTRSASTSSARTPPTSSPRRRSRSSSTRRRGRSAAATHAHPTLSEVIGEAAMAVDGRSINF